MTDDLKAQVNQHRYEIDSLKDAFEQQVKSSQELNTSVNSLINKLDVYIERNEHTRLDVKRVNSELKSLREHSNQRFDSHSTQINTLSTKIAGHSPVIESVSGIFNKILGTFFVGIASAVGAGFAIAKALSS